jgi:hypothetical protein
VVTTCTARSECSSGRKDELLVERMNYWWLRHALLEANVVVVERMNYWWLRHALLLHHGSQNRGKPLGYRGNRPNRAGSQKSTRAIILGLREYLRNRFCSGFFKL